MRDLFYKFLFLALIVTISSTTFDYYWKEFNGEIPDDAVVGGNDKNNKPIYIAQVYVENHGVLPARLYKGQNTVTASKSGLYISNNFIKILCSDKPEKLSWVPTNATTFHIGNRGKHLVVGGTENGKIVYIGRIFHEEEVIVGKVCGYNFGNALLYFAHNETEVSTSTYEVLVCELPEIFNLSPEPT